MKGVEAAKSVENVERIEILHFRVNTLRQGTNNSLAKKKRFFIALFMSWFSAKALMQANKYV